MTSLAEFLFPAPAERSTGGIVRWWESRRLPYNLIVGGTGIFALGGVTILRLLPPGLPDQLPPLGFVALYALAANVCYLLGPVLEIVATRIWGRAVLPVGPALYRMGLTFSVGLTLLPVLIYFLSWIARVVVAVFFPEAL
jgi:hypothetical protein